MFFERHFEKIEAFKGFEFDIDIGTQELFQEISKEKPKISHRLFLKPEEEKEEILIPYGSFRTIKFKVIEKVIEKVQEFSQEESEEEKYSPWGIGKAVKKTWEEFLDITVSQALLWSALNIEPEQVFKFISPKSIEEVKKMLVILEMKEVVLERIKSCVKQKVPPEIEDIRYLTLALGRADKETVRKIEPYLEEVVEEIKKVMGEEWYKYEEKRLEEVIIKRFDWYKYVPEEKKEIYKYYHFIKQYLIDKMTEDIRDSEELEKIWREKIDKLPELPEIERRTKELAETGLKNYEGVMFSG